MLVRYTPRPSCILRRTRHLQPPLGFSLNQSRRSFVSLDVLKDGFLDLAIALPIPPSWPTYSTTIILCTVLSRLALTVPFSIWSKRNQWRTEEQVLPRLQSEARGIAEKVSKDMRKEKVRGTEEELRKIHHARTKKAVEFRRNELFAEHSCWPIASMVIPPLIQLPVFVGCSIALQHISQHPTPFDSESFLTLSTLIHPDPTAVLPIALGFITFANVESSSWFMTDQQREREVKVQEWKARKIGTGEGVIEPRKVIQTSLRAASIGRILIAMAVPGSVVLYWVTSATFGLVQTWIFDYWELRRKRRLAARTFPSSLASTPPSHLPAVSPRTVNQRQRRKK